MKKRYVKPVISLCLIAALGIAGSLAYLTDETDEVTNTFTAGANIAIDLYELNSGEKELTTAAYTIIPGDVAEKDPQVVTEEDSADSYIFIEVTENMGTLDVVFSDYITYDVLDSWTEIVDKDATDSTTTYVYTGEDKVPDEVGDGLTLYILKDVVTESETNLYTNGSVEYSEDITNEMLTALGDVDLTLEFVAYAIQTDNVTATNAETASTLFLDTFKPAATD